MRTYALLYPLLDLTTTLDPYFSIAYRFGAIYLGEPYPGGPGRPDLAVALLQKGLAAQPSKWQYLMDLGFVQYWHLHDYAAAATAFTSASELPGVPVDTSGTPFTLDPATGAISVAPEATLFP